MALTQAGPAWTATGKSPIDTGRFPLGVEAATLSNAARLVPGINSGTAHARYYALHAVAAAKDPGRAGKSGSLDHAREQVRRAEVVMAAVTADGVMDAADFLIAGSPLSRVAEGLADSYRGIRLAAPRLLELEATGTPHMIALRLLAQCSGNAPIAVRLHTRDSTMFAAWRQKQHGRIPFWL